MATWIAIGQVAKEFGVTTQTIRNWTKLGKLSSIRTLGGHRRYSKEEIDEKLGRKQEAKQTICYSRVSSSDQKEDLKRQSEELLDYCERSGIEEIELIEEVGSGLNYDKRGLKKLIDRILLGEVERVVLSYRDRLVRFGIEIIERICKVKEVSLVILNKEKEKNFEEELTEDVLSILTVFCAKIYGKRSHERRKKRQEQG